MSYIHCVNSEADDFSSIQVYLPLHSSMLLIKLNRRSLWYLLPTLCSF